MWQNDTQMLAIVVELLLKYNVIECASVANWVFMKEMTGQFTRYNLLIKFLVNLYPFITGFICGKFYT